jgi:hypothetical protein
MERLRLKSMDSQHDTIVNATNAALNLVAVPYDLSEATVTLGVRAIQDYASTDDPRALEEWVRYEVHTGRPADLRGVVAAICDACLAIDQDAHVAVNFYDGIKTRVSDIVREEQERDSHGSASELVTSIAGTIGVHAKRLARQLTVMGDAGAAIATSMGLTPKRIQYAADFAQLAEIGATGGGSSGTFADPTEQRSSLAALQLLTAFPLLQRYALPLRLHREHARCTQEYQTLVQLAGLPVEVRIVSAVAAYFGQVYGQAICSPSNALRQMTDEAGVRWDPEVLEHLYLVVAARQLSWSA